MGLVHPGFVVPAPLVLLPFLMAAASLLLAFSSFAAGFTVAVPALVLLRLNALSRLRQAHR